MSETLCPQEDDCLICQRHQNNWECTVLGIAVTGGLLLVWIVLEVYARLVN